MNRVLSLIYVRTVKLIIALSALSLSAVGFAYQIMGIKAPLISTPTLPYALLIIGTGLLLAKAYTNHRQTRQKTVPPKVALLLLFTCMLASYVEMFILRASNISLILLATTLAVAVLTNGKALLLFIFVSATLGIVAAQYLVYAPSYGNDTWRDVMWAEYTLAYGDYTESPIFHTAYPLPMVVLLYSTASQALGISPLASSVVVGLAYLVALPLLAMLVIRRAFPEADEYARYTPLVMLSVPMIALWGVWFIPQAYAVILLFISILLAFLEGSPRRYLVGAVVAMALVFGHPGFSLIASATLLWLSFGSGRILRPFAIILALFTAFYDIYLTFSRIYSGGLTILTALLGETGKTVLTSTESSVPYVSRVLPWLSTAALVPLGYVSYFAVGARRDLVVRIFLSSIFLIGTGYLLTTLNPNSTADRYVGLPGVVLLATLAPLGLKKYLEGSRWGIAYAYALLSIFVLVLAFGGSFTPYSHLVTTPSPYSAYGVLTYGEKEVVDNIASLLDVSYKTNVVTDWRTGMVIYDYFVPSHKVTGVSRGFRVDSTTFVFTGSYGLLGDEKFIIQWRGLVILRESSLVMPEAWRLSQTDIDKLLGYNGLFSGFDIWLIARN